MGILEFGPRLALTRKPSAVWLQRTVTHSKSNSKISRRRCRHHSHPLLVLQRLVPLAWDNWAATDPPRLTASAKVTLGYSSWANNCSPQRQHRRSIDQYNIGSGCHGRLDNGRYRLARLALFVARASSLGCTLAIFRQKLFFSRRGNTDRQCPS